MTPVTKSVHPKHKGAVLIIAMIFVVIFSALAVSMATMSGMNTQIASNQQKVDCALGSAESGLEVQRHWLTPITMPASTPPANYFSTIVSNLQSDLDANSISNFSLENNGTTTSATLDSATSQTFSGQLRIDPNNPNILQVYATGGDGQIMRTIKVDFDIAPYEWPIFNYGLATKGPLTYSGNPTMNAVNEAWEADLYIESWGSTDAMYVNGNCNFDGDIMIGNPAADADFNGDVLIAGDHGQDAIDNHVHIGVDPVEFPLPDTARFLPYATGPVIDASTDTTDNMVLSNAKILANSNNNFEGNVQLLGILFIEAPNLITFSGNVALQGIIVAPGDAAADPVTNRIDILGNFESGPYPASSEFDAIRDEEGSSIIAPGFAMSFQGNFSTLEGVVALSGVHFSGNVDAQIKGTIINYSDNPMIIDGNATMNFDRIASTKIPAGYDTLRVLTYNPSSYSEL